MTLYARSCERPSKSSASVFLPSSVSNSYPFSTGTQGSSRRFSVAFRPSSACSASSLASSSRAACHSSRVPTVCSVMGVASCRGLRQQRPARGAKLIGRHLSLGGRAELSPPRSPLPRGCPPPRGLLGIDVGGRLGALGAA